MNLPFREAEPPKMFGGYSPREGFYDEFLGPDGKPRAHWNSLVTQLDRIGNVELRHRWEQAQAQINRDGFTFNPYVADGIVSRPWTLDAIPLVIGHKEWTDLTDRLAQRALLMEHVLQDLFGPQRLLREKILPPALLFGHPAYFPTYHGLQRAGKRYLMYHGMDLARAPNGQWWVTGDRTRSSFGLGYVLENRLITSRMLPSAFRESRVLRLAPFFKQFKQELLKLAPGSRENPRVVVWTRGPDSRTYFEDSYLARYLGYTLVEGGDLAVRENKVMLKTLGGLLPVEVLLRRLDEDDCDPVELRPDSLVGISSLVEVLRSGRVSVANSLGSRLVESPLLLAFLPQVCRFLLGEDLKAPSVSTWWCGQPEGLAHVRANFDNLMIRPAYRIGDEPPVHTANLPKPERQKLLSDILASPNKYVGQEMIDRSMAPVLTTSGTAAWHVALRAFFVSRDDGYTALSGGLARLSPQPRTLDFTMTAGELSQDVWIVADVPVEEETLLTPSSILMNPRRSGSELPSRVADDLFWLGRYTERAEQMARLLRIVFESLASESVNGPERRPLLRVLAEQGQIDPDYVVAGLGLSLPEIADVLPAAVFDTSRPRALRSSILNAARVAAKVRDRISLDMWRTIDRADSHTSHWNHSDNTDPDTLDIMNVLDAVLADLVCFAGLAAESMTRTLGWRFLDLGRRIERSWQTTILLRSFFVDIVQTEPMAIEAALRVSDSLMTYRNRYLSTLQLPVSLDLLITDETNPRSIGHQLERIQGHLDAMPRDEHRAGLNPEQRLALSLQHAVRLADVFELSAVQDNRRDQLDRLLRRLVDTLPKLSDAVSSRFLIHAGLPRHYGSSAESLPGNKHFGS